MRSLLWPLLLVLLAGCGGLPQPFFGNPGNAGALLAQPPPSRLAIPTPAQSLLSDAGGNAWAEAMAAALVNEEIPSSHTPVRAGDWSLTMAAELQGRNVVPTYTVNNAKGEAQGTTQGAPVPASAWATNDPAVLKAAAGQAAPGVAALLTRIEAARLQSDPNSLQNRPARVYFSGIDGAPGDGNRSLATQMRIKLAGYGIVIQDTAANADFALHGQVRTAPGTGGTMRVELQWIVEDSRGERGRILQLNELPPRTIEPYWGDVAVVAAEEAAGGVRDVILNASGPRLDNKAEPTKPSPSPSPSGRGPG
ncbi:MAG TPA: hypothetical protein VE650_19300 [Acetobacteraceae bacterium]|nr:hypothetical protein [Acetobacteraceae bacterium]